MSACLLTPVLIFLQASCGRTWTTLAGTPPAKRRNRVHHLRKSQNFIRGDTRAAKTLAGAPPWRWRRGSGLLGNSGSCSGITRGHRDWMMPCHKGRLQLPAAEGVAHATLKACHAQAASRALYACEKICVRRMFRGEGLWSAQSALAFCTPFRTLLGILFRLRNFDEKIQCSLEQASDLRPVRGHDRERFEGTRQLCAGRCE